MKKERKALKNDLKDKLMDFKCNNITWHQSSTNEDFVYVYKFISNQSKEFHMKKLLKSIEIESQD